MMKTTRRWRTIAAVLTATAGGFAGMAAPAADASQGATWQDFEARGWTCFVPPPAPDSVACFNPGLGRPFPNNPDPPPAYSVRLFDRATGRFLHTAHLIRADLYRGQPCGSGAYRFIPLIGYWECVHP